jgi:hypothetical protein
MGRAGLCHKLAMRLDNDTWVRISRRVNVYTTQIGGTYRMNLNKPRFQEPVVDGNILRLLKVIISLNWNVRSNILNLIHPIQTAQ